MTNRPASAGNEELQASFPAFYLQYQGLVRRVLYKFLGPTDLDDAVQEAFIKIWRGLAGFNHRSSLKTWIYSIVTRVGIDQLRRKKNVRTAVADPDDIASSEDVETSQLYRNLVRKGLDQLSDEHRITLILSVYEGLSVEEISKATDTKEGTVKSRVHSARQSMIAFLEKNGVGL